MNCLGSSGAGLVVGTYNFCSQQEFCEMPIRPSFFRDAGPEVMRNVGPTERPVLASFGCI